MKLNLREAANAERGKAVLVLQAPELTLDGGAAPVKVTEPLAFTRDQRVKPGSLPPHGGRLALAGRATPLRRLPFEVGPRERPRSVFAGWRAMVASLEARILAP